MHSPLIEKIEIVRRAKVRRKFLSFLRQRSGKSARLTAKNFDRAAVNDIHDVKAEAEAERLKEEVAQALPQNKLKKMPLRLNLTLRLLKLQLAIKTRNCQLTNR